jgi:hypothetical protein
MSGIGISEIIECPVWEATDRTMLNSLAGANIFNIERRTREPEKPIGFDTLFPSISIAVIVEDTSLRSSWMIQYTFFACQRTRSNDSFSTFLTMISTSCIDIGSVVLRIYCVVI